MPHRSLYSLNAQGVVFDGTIPSIVMTSDPLPPYPSVPRYRGQGVRCIDGWRRLAGVYPRAGALTMAHTPVDIAAAFDYFVQRQVDGIFLNQADLITAIPFLDLFI
ncbi:hypothetical protein [Paenibacillus sp. MBLB4367]|uniref:hypothetical protein n=1 Tax=Paenibacillus sp. MBLB4367 TaxID=3384767 RepID=UPI003907FCFA